MSVVGPWWFILLSAATALVQEVDPNGYILFCPCMGRFGNQVDHYLGALGFAKSLNRTLVLPPWVEYRRGEARSVQVPFSTYFDVKALSEFHKVTPMEEFMRELASSVWPPDRRTSLCYAYRSGAISESCNAKEGNPFGPFWDEFSVNFVSSQTYGPLHYDVHRTNVADEWMKKFPANEWPVLAFTGAPAAFPVQEDNVYIQRFLRWNRVMTGKGEEFIKKHLATRGKFIGIHLRNGADWKRACDFVSSSPTLFASAQCLGYRNEHGLLTQEMCTPSEDTIVKQLRSAIKQHQAKAIFVASDQDHMIEHLEKDVGKADVSFHRLDELDPHLDLVILGRADHFIGNCVSSFSSFVKRARDVEGLTSSFWGFVPRKRTHDSGEL